MHTKPPKLDDIELLFSYFNTGNITPNEIDNEVNPDVNNIMVINDK